MNAAASQIPTPETLFRSWLAARCLPSLCSFVPTVQNPVLAIVIGQINGRDVYAYGALARQHCALWWACWSLDRDEALKHAWEYLPKEVRVRHDIIQQMRDFLERYVPTCPLCRSSYDRSDDVLRELHSRGQVQIRCDCERAKPEGSKLLQDIRAIRDSTLSSVAPPTSPWYEVVEVSIGRAVAVRMSVHGPSERVVLLFFRDNFRAGDFSVSQVWQRRKVAILERQEDACKKKSGQPGVNLLRLRPRLHPRRGTWECQSPLNERVTCVIAPGYSIKGEGWYYCQPLANQSGGSEWRILVEPIHPVPVRHQPRFRLF
ncbi:hypothetical protein KBB85_03425 [Patescibacteria group bacterium]|nr:hypothetical protein [Patescibacteria group bacterium]